MKYYNYRKEDKLNEEIIFCVDNDEDSNHYGNVQRIFQATKNTLINPSDLLKKLAIEFYKESWEEIEYIVLPKNIVETAGAWDDIEFINYLYDRNFFETCDGIITPDGAVFFEINDNNLVETNVK